LLLRLAIPIRCGAVSGDDTFLLTACFNWWKHGDVAGLASSYGSSGIVYAGFHHFPWAWFAGVISFRLAPLFMLTAILTLAPALLLYWQLDGLPGKRWAVLLAASSPLMGYLSLSLLPLWWLAPLGGTVGIQVALAEDRGQAIQSNRWFFVIGLVSGYLCGTYPSLSPMTLGLFLWLLTRRKPWRVYCAFLVGCVIGYAPFLWLLATHWATLNPRLQIGDQATSWVQLFGGIFKYWGVAPTGRLNDQQPWAQLEGISRDITPWLWLCAVLLSFWALSKEKLAHRKVPNYVQLGAYTFIAFLPFAYVTHTETWHHQAGNLWWVPALVLPWTVRSLFPRASNQILASLVLFNIAGLVVLFAPRLAHGTTAESTETYHSHGPAWWMYEALAGKIKMRAQQELALGIDRPLAVRCERVFQFYLPQFFTIRYPELNDKVKWVPELLVPCDLVVSRDRSQPYFLRVNDWPDDWRRPAQIIRQLIHIVNSAPLNYACQIGVHLPNVDGNTLEFVNNEGKSVEYCHELLPGSDVIWLRLASLPAGITTIWAYYGGKPDNDHGLQKPEAVFEFFDGFDGDLTAWEPLGDGNWEVANGICRLTILSKGNAVKGLQLLLRHPTISSGIIEARLRFAHFPTPINAGVTFDSQPAVHSYLWLLTGWGTTRLAELDPNNTPLTIEETQWYWHGHAKKWFVVGAEWNGSKIKTTVGDNVVFDRIDLNERGVGRVGLGVIPNPGIGVDQFPMVEFDWVRLRTSFGDKVPNIDVGPPEYAH
jgi:hypothetical protein